MMFCAHVHIFSCMCVCVCEFILAKGLGVRINKQESLQPLVLHGHREGNSSHVCQSWGAVWLHVLTLFALLMLVIVPLQHEAGGCFNTGLLRTCDRSKSAGPVICAISYWVQVFKSSQLAKAAVWFGLSRRGVNLTTARTQIFKTADCCLLTRVCDVCEKKQKNIVAGFSFIPVYLLLWRQERLWGHKSTGATFTTD